MNDILSTIYIVIKAFAFFIFFFISAYVLLFGKKGTGIKLDYIFACIFLLFVILRL